MASDRFGNTVKNALYSYVNQFIFIILGLVSRYVFIEYLGSDYLGANGLFTNILGVLSLSELGVGAALGVALYKPLAEKDTEKD